MMVLESSTKLYLKYNRSLELAFRVLSGNSPMHFDSMAHVASYLDCDDNQTALRILRQICRRYKIVCLFNDDGVTLLNGNGGYRDYTIME